MTEREAYIKKRAAEIRQELAVINTLFGVPVNLNDQDEVIVAAYYHGESAMLPKTRCEDDGSYTWLASPALCAALRKAIGD